MYKLLRSDPLLIRTSQVPVFRKDIACYRVTANGKHIGYITRYASNVWGITSKFVEPLAPLCSTRKAAVKYTVDAYRESL